MWILESWKNQSESWKSPWKVFEICFWKGHEPWTKCFFTLWLYLWFSWICFGEICQNFPAHRFQWDTNFEHEKSGVLVLEISLHQSAKFYIFLWVHADYLNFLPQHTYIGSHLNTEYCVTERDLSDLPETTEDLQIILCTRVKFGFHACLCHLHLLQC